MNCKICFFLFFVFVSSCAFAFDDYCHFLKSRNIPSHHEGKPALYDQCLDLEQSSLDFSINNKVEEANIFSEITAEIHACFLNILGAVENLKLSSRAFCVDFANKLDEQIDKILKKINVFEEQELSNDQLDSIDVLKAKIDQLHEFFFEFYSYGMLREDFEEL